MNRIDPRRDAEAAFLGMTKCSNHYPPKDETKVYKNMLIYQHFTMPASLLKMGWRFTPSKIMSDAFG